MCFFLTTWHGIKQCWCLLFDVFCVIHLILLLDFQVKLQLRSFHWMCNKKGNVRNRCCTSNKPKLMWITQFSLFWNWLICFVYFSLIWIYFNLSISINVKTKRFYISLEVQKLQHYFEYTTLNQIKLKHMKIIHIRSGRNLPNQFKTKKEKCYTVVPENWTVVFPAMHFKFYTVHSLKYST